MCCARAWNLSHASLTFPEALAGLRELRTTNPALHKALNSADPVQVTADSDKELYNDAQEDDCDVPLDVLSDHLLSGGSSVADNFVVGEDGGISRSGNADESEAEDECNELLGRGQRKRIPVWRYQGSAWEEH